MLIEGGRQCDQDQMNSRVSYLIQITTYYSSPLLTMSMPLNSLSTLTDIIL